MTGQAVGLVMLPVDAIQPNPHNVRSQIGDVTELAASIRAEGILQPLVVEPAGPGTFTLAIGHRRHAAAKRLGLQAVPCIIRQPAGDRRTTARMVIENVHRKGLPPLDEARAYRALLDDGMTRGEIARATGVSQATIATRLALLDLPREAQTMVRDGQLSLGAAAHLGRELKRDGQGTVTDGARCPRHFHGAHPLARNAKDRCDAEDHPTVGRLNGIACEACWEASIRDDCVGTVEHSNRHVNRVHSGFVDEVAVQRAINGDLSVSLSIAEAISDRNVIRIRQALNLPAVAS
jgi:ParB family chromosome partitioning protein